MRALLGLLLAGLILFPAVAQDRGIEIDPNTKIEGGADVRGSGADAGSTARPEKKAEDIENRTPAEKRAPDKDKPISGREPQEREREEAAKGESAPQR